MNKFAVIIFENEAKAYEGTRALTELQADGSIVLFSEAVIAKDLAGTISLKNAASGGPRGTAVGAFTGGLIGLIGGPVGAAMGLAGGALIGSYGDLLYAGVSARFVQKVADALKPGSTAIVAEIAEDWLVPLDSRMRPLNGVVLRTYRSDVEDDTIAKEIAEQTSDIERLKAEYIKAKGDAKKQFEVHLDAARLALEESRARAKARMDALKAEAHAKISALSEQAAEAASDLKAGINQRIVKANAEYEARAAKLRQAWDLTKDALD
ncbi:MAG: hypothetical protein JWQ94_1398 [Tardiphaga sp.]|nr:hypothetical protein [Tardiphaga sp.]